MKKCLIYIGLLTGLLFCAAPLAQAQYFDWVKTYQSTYSSGISPDNDNMVVDMATDSRGNIYFIGCCVRGAAINGEELLAEVNHYEPSHNHKSLCIVKMSPSGEMLWHKAISSWDGNLYFGNIQVVGDSAVVCYVPFSVNGVNSPVYWIDSLVQYPNWFVPTDSICTYGNALLTFDLEGDLKEQHFLHVGVLDTLGVPVARNSVVATSYLWDGSMYVDSDGNVILGVGCNHEQAWRPYWCDTCETPSWKSIEYSVENGGVGAVRIMVDGTRSLFYYPENRPIKTNAKLLKFSPHFDSLLEVRYLMQARLDSPRTGLGVPGITDTRIMHIDSDPEGNLYVVGYIEVSRTDTIVPIDSAQGLTLHLKDQSTGFIIKYDPQLHPIYIKQIEEAYKTKFIHDVVIGDDLFILGGGSGQGLLNYDGEPLYDLYQGGVTFLRIHKDDGRLLSYGKACRPVDSETWHAVDNNLDTKMAVCNNRVSTQVRFLGGINFANRTVRVPESPYWGNGAVMWDYDGHQLAMIDYNAPNPDNIPVDVLFSDSSLYFSGMFIGQATFGDTSFNVSHSNAYLARYVDTAFLHPYVHPETPDTGNVRIQLADDGGAFVAYPNPFRQRININYNGTDAIVSAYLTDMAGRREEVRLQGVPADNNGPACYSLDLTSRPQATYLLTLVTASGRQHTLRLFKQSDIFGN